MFADCKLLNLLNKTSKKKKNGTQNQRTYIYQPKNSMSSDN